MAVMDIVVETRVMTLPVMTSVMVMRYSVMTPLMSPANGGAHNSPMDVELTGESTMFWGGLEGAEKSKRGKCQRLIVPFSESPLSEVP